MIRFRQFRTFLALALLCLASAPVRAETTEISVMVDGLTLVSNGFTAIGEIRAERGAWNAYVAPELEIDQVRSHGEFWTGTTSRTDLWDGAGAWIGIGVRPWKEQGPREFLTGVHLHLRRTDTRITSSKYVDVPRPGSPFDSSSILTSRRREVAWTLGIGGDASLALGPYDGSLFLRHAFLEPYVRGGVRLEHVATTAYAGGDRTPGTTGAIDWNPEIRIGVFAGWKF